MGPYRLRTRRTCPSAYSPRARSAGSASPARLKVRTLRGTAPERSSSAAAVGTMVARRTSWSATEGSSSAFSTSTSVPPQQRVPKISATETSKLMEVEPRTRARSSSDTVSRSQCSRTATEAWRIITPLGRPVEPEVKITCDRFSGPAPLSGAVSGSPSPAPAGSSSAAPSGTRSARPGPATTSRTPASSIIRARRSRGCAGSKGT